jgi:outer membrane protein OmpA-like peptidoglycan-associated protein
MTRWARGRSQRLLLGACLAWAAGPTAQAAGGLTLLTEQPLPMAVRDGRIAETTARAIPFPSGEDALDAPTAAALDGFVAAIATDCFLFAQAIGHVRPGADAEGDTLAAHRLARARAEAIGARLQRAGLPGDAVSSAWDRQFAVREPRVTLWIFSQTPGQDCAGTPLPGAAALTAAARTPQPPTMAARREADDEPAPGIHRTGASTTTEPVQLADAAQTVAVPAEAEPTAAAPSPANVAETAASPPTPPSTPPHREIMPRIVAAAIISDDPRPASAAAGPVAIGASEPVAVRAEGIVAPAAAAAPTHEIETIGVDAVPKATQTASLPAESPFDPGAPPVERSTMAGAADGSVTAPQRPADVPADRAIAGLAPTSVTAAEPEAGPEPEAASQAIASAPWPAASAAAIVPQHVELVFAPDSTALGPQAEAQLQAVLAALAGHGEWEVALQATVDDVAGTLPTDRALAYNQDLAAQRQIRVEDWLGTRGAGPVMRIRRELLPHDPTRRLVLKARPLP